MTARARLMMLNPETHLFVIDRLAGPTREQVEAVIAGVKAPNMHTIVFPFDVDLPEVDSADESGRIKIYADELAALREVAEILDGAPGEDRQRMAALIRLVVARADEAS